MVAVSGSLTSSLTGVLTRGQREPLTMRAELRRLPRTGDALGRADRMLTDLIRHGTDSVGFRDRLPYVLERLAGVSRAIDEESRGARTQRFSDWWSGEPIPHRQELYSLRHAELKALKGALRTSAW